MILAVEVIICCLCFGVYRILRIKSDPAYKISNMPVSLQKKVMHMRGFRERNLHIMTDWEKFVKKIPYLLLWAIGLVILASLAGAKSFSTGFIYAIVIKIANVKKYVIIMIIFFLFIFIIPIHLKFNRNIIFMHYS